MSYVRERLIRTRISKHLASRQFSTVALHRSSSPFFSFATFFPLPPAPSSSNFSSQRFFDNRFRANVALIFVYALFAQINLSYEKLLQRSFDVAGTDYRPIDRQILTIADIE